MEFSDSQPNFFEEMNNEVLALPAPTIPSTNLSTKDSLDATFSSPPVVKLLAMLTANCRSQERTITILREQGPLISRKIEMEMSLLNKRLNKVETILESLLLQNEEQTECLTILTGRRKAKLEKDCERRKRKREEITASLQRSK